jgi:hypothetical protein
VPRRQGDQHGGGDRQHGVAVTHGCRAMIQAVGQRGSLGGEG